VLSSRTRTVPDPTCAVLDVRHASGPTSAPQSPLDRLLSNRQHATRALHHAAVGLALWWTDVALVVAHIASQSSSPAHLAPAPRPRDARLLLRPAPPHGGDDLLRQAAAAPPEGRPPLWTDADGRRPFRHALWRWHRGGDPGPTFSSGCCARRGSVTARRLSGVKGCASRGPVAANPRRSSGSAVAGGGGCGAGRSAEPRLWPLPAGQSPRQRDVCLCSHAPAGRLRRALLAERQRHRALVRLAAGRGRGRHALGASLGRCALPRRRGRERQDDRPADGVSRGAGSTQDGVPPRRAPLQRAAVPLPRRGRGRRQALPLLELGGRGRERVRRCGSTVCPWRFDGARANHVPTTHSSRGCIRRPRRHAEHRDDVRRALDRARRSRPAGARRRRRGRAGGAGGRAGREVGGLALTAACAAQERRRQDDSHI
ncbi:hypothetical protein EMIHUDRAFT_456317, partial [Emiliania huxleyi CCMP1516]